MQKIIQVSNISKTYKKVEAVKNVSLTISSGESLALLGPNGAGKTTLVEMMEGLTKPDNGGAILIDGMKWQKSETEIRKIMGLSLQETRLIDRMKTREMLQLFASFYKLDDTSWKEAMKKTGLVSKSEDYIENLSGGQKQKLALSLAIMNKPRILILDEPTTGLDPNSRRDIWNIIKTLEEDNTTLILTTHYMEEAEFLCNRVVIMDGGEIIRQGSLDELLHNEKVDEIITFSVEANKEAHSSFVYKLKNIDGVIELSNVNNVVGNSKKMNYSIKVKQTTQTLPRIFAQAESYAFVVKELQCRKMNLDDLFISLTGKNLHD